MATTGSTTIDFGAAPGGNVASTAVTGQGSILTTSYAEAWVMSEASADHNAYEHRMVPIRLTCGDLVNATGFTIHATSDWRLSGTFKVRWVWN